MCLGFQRELIVGNVLRLQRDSLFDIGTRIADRLIRQAEHQVEIQRIKAGVPSRLDGANRLCRIVHPAERPQVRIVETLHADGEAIDARLAEAGELVPLGAAGIGLHGDFNVGARIGERTHPGQKGANCLGGEQTRRAATDKNAVYFSSPHLRQILCEIGQQGVDIVFFGQFVAHRVRVEITVRTFLFAPGQVDIQR